MSPAGDRGPRPWKTLSRRTLLERRPWVVAGDERVQLPDGRVVEDFNWVRLRDYAVVVALTDGGDVVIERSYKHGAGRVALSLPAGYLEENEDPESTARRELLEETGHAAASWTSLGRFVVDGNTGCGEMHAFLARGASRVAEPASGDLEEIVVELMPLSRLVRALARGEVAQLGTAAAIGLASLALRSDL
ncbi:MAG: NUDIX hydrolase [Candidatus Limnocylindria bacterium]